MTVFQFILEYKSSDADSRFTSKVEKEQQIKRTPLPSAKPLQVAKSLYGPTLFIFQPALRL
jgi:hypothetical protein